MEVSSFKDYIETFPKILASQHFAVYSSRKETCVSIFPTAQGRDAYVNEMCRMIDELREKKDKEARGLTCKAVTLEWFLKFAAGQELSISNYSWEDEGAVEFRHP